MACKKCGAELPEGMDLCSKCRGETTNSQCGGEVLELPNISLPAAGKRDAKKPPVVVLCILGIVLVGIFFVMSNGRRQQGADGEFGSGTADREAETIASVGDELLGEELENEASLFATTTTSGEEIPGVEASEYVVHINIYLEEGDGSGTDGRMDGNPMSGTVVVLREGADVCEGEVFRTLQAGEGGRIDTTLPPGTYTAQIDVPGYVRSFQQIRVEEGETSADSYVRWQKRLVQVNYYPGNLDSDTWTLVASHEYAYDSRGNLVKKFCHVEEGYWGHCDIRESYEYDSQGRLFKTVKYSSDGSVESRIEMSYDSLGNQIKRVYYENNGSIASWTELSYDSRGNEIKRVGYNSDGSISWQEETSYSYDSQGNEIKVAGEYFWTEKTYDSQGNLTMRAEYGSDRPDPYLEEYYDSKGRVVRSVSPDETNGERVYDENYEYDDQGNLTKLTTTSYRGYEYDQANCCYVKLPTPDSVYTYYTEYRNEYDSWGHLVKSSVYKNGTDMRQWSENTYDNGGNLVREAVYKVGFYDGIWRCTMEKIYDDQGNILEETEYNDYLWGQMGYGWDVDSMKIEYIYE